MPTEKKAWGSKGSAPTLAAKPQKQKNILVVTWVPVAVDALPHLLETNLPRTFVNLALFDAEPADRPGMDVTVQAFARSISIRDQVAAHAKVVFLGKRAAYAFSCDDVNPRNWTLRNDMRGSRQRVAYVPLPVQPEHETDLYNLFH